MNYLLNGLLRGFYHGACLKNVKYDIIREILLTADAIYGRINHKIREEADNMPTEKEIVIIQKATVYDLKRIINKEPDKTYTQEELEKILDAYITGAEQ